MVWADTHTDEVPIVLGFLLILGFALGAPFPQQYLVSWLLLGASVPISETLVHFSVLRAPYPAGANLPWAALVAYIPALLGVAVGAGVRRLAVHKLL